MSIYSIYKIQNKLNGKCYIGFDSNYPNRIRDHITESKKSRRNTKFYNAIRKYGWENFDITVLYQSKEFEHTLNVMENHFITENDSYHNGYNSTTGGERGFANHDCVKRKISDKNKGKNLTLEQKEKISHIQKGVPKSEEMKNKVSNTLKGHTVSEETRNKISKALLGKSNPRTEEHQRKLAIAITGKKRTPEQRQRISEKTKEAMARRKLKSISQEA